MLTEELSSGGGREMTQTQRVEADTLEGNPGEVREAFAFEIFPPHAESQDSSVCKYS